MNKLMCITLLLMAVCANAFAQKGTYKFRVMNVTPNGVRVSGKIVEQYDIIEDTAQTEWLKSNACMFVRPLEHVSYEKKIKLYKGVLYEISPKDVSYRKDKFFWWIKLNHASSKGSSKVPRHSIFSREHYMYDNELIIEIPKKLNKGQGYKFISLADREKYFYCKYDKDYPIILISREMLNSVGFDGESIEMEVWFENNYNKAEKLLSSMVIINKDK